MKRVVSSILFPPHHQLSCGTAACAVKKHGRYEFRFTLRGSSTHCPIKKLRLRGSRLSRTYCSSAVRVFVIIIIVVVVIVIVISVAQNASLLSCDFRLVLVRGEETRRTMVEKKEECGDLVAPTGTSMRRKKCVHMGVDG